MKSVYVLPNNRANLDITRLGNNSLGTLALISISDPDQAKSDEVIEVESNPYCVASLSLWFFTPEYLSKQGIRESEVRDEFLVNASHTDLIVQFVLSYSSVDTLIISCDKGKSRSYTIAMALKELMGTSLRVVHMKGCVINPTINDLMINTIEAVKF